MQNIGRHISRLRESRRATVEQLAAYLEVPAKQLSGIERGLLLPSKYQLVQVAGWAGTDEIDLLGIFQQQLIELNFGHGNPDPNRYHRMMRELKDLEDAAYTTKVLKFTRPLSEYIESATYYKSSKLEYTLEKILPDGMPKLIINLADDGDHFSSTGKQQDTYNCERACLIGIQDRYCMMNLPKRTTRIVIRFRPHGIHILSGIPQQLFTNKVVDAQNVFPEIYKLRETLLTAKNVQQIFQKLELFFLKRWHTRIQNDVETNVTTFLVSNILSPISSLVSRSGYSQKHLIDIFKIYTGVTPKKLQQIRRFSNVIQDLELSAIDTSLSKITYDHNYFDQAHFTKEFAHFTGVTPKAYLKSGNTCSRFVIS